MQEYFDELTSFATSQLQGDEILTASFSAEDSDFVRFNHAAVRQAGKVVQRNLGLRLILGRRHASSNTTLTGDPELDRARVTEELRTLRDLLPQLPEDPYLLYSTDARSSEAHGEDALPEAAEATSTILDSAQSTDFVGLNAGGGIYRGFGNSLGQRNWFSSHSFNLDWSLYHQADKAVKLNHSGFRWEAPALQEKIAGGKEQLEVLAKPSKSLEPGHYRVYLSPAAVWEVMTTLCWGGFGLKDHRTKQTSLLQMVEGSARLHEGVDLLENTAEGVAPNFQDAGFIRPDRVSLIQGGCFRNCLASPRSAKVYGMETNGASESEMPQSLDMAGGSLASRDVLSRLETGLYINNLHYLNYSDRPNGRMTGMTRFATFLVENGNIQAPLDVMRFDETVYRLFGANLMALTEEREFMLDPSTYGSRSTFSARVPGALIEDFALTL